MEKQRQTVSVTPKEEASAIRKMSMVGIIGNVLLSAFKLTAGIIGNSGAMISDAVHSLSDVLTTFIALIGTKLSKKEADKEHPYGHERIETLASMALGIILLLTAAGIGFAGMSVILQGNYADIEPPTMIALIAAAVSIVTKEAMFWYTRHYAQKINSAAFMADAWHHRSDAISSIGALIGIAGAMAGYPVLDSVASVLICILVAKVAIDILRTAASNMLDTSCDGNFEAQLRLAIEREPDVVRIDEFRTRMFGNRIYVDLEIALDGDMTLTESHRIAERVHDDLEANFPDIKHVMVHANPA